MEVVKTLNKLKTLRTLETLETLKTLKTNDVSPTPVMTPVSSIDSLESYELQAQHESQLQNTSTDVVDREIKKQYRLHTSPYTIHHWPEIRRKIVPRLQSFHSV